VSVLGGYCCCCDGSGEVDGDGSVVGYDFY
jgi:hypothetical protein